MLRKPHRVAFLVPELAIDGGDASNVAETGLLLWVALIEACQRHPGLSVYDAESTPLVAQDGHFTPPPARPGAAPDDAFYGPTRRDEVVWLELTLPRGGAVRLHALAHGGRRETFEALGRGAGDQIHQVLERWLAARGLGPLPRRFEAVEAGEILAAVRVLAPVLAEQARAYVVHEPPPAAVLADDDAAAEGSGPGRAAGPPGPGVGEHAAGADLAGGAGSGPAVASVAARAPARPPIARALAARLPATLRPAALRLLALALREDLGDLILAVDPDQPQALFDQFRGALARGRRDHALLRRIVASAPGWAFPYGELVAGSASEPPAPLAPTRLETSAAAGIAALCRPGHLGTLATAAVRLADDGRIDEAIRLVERAVALDPQSREAHAALLGLHRRTGRLGAWQAQAQRSALLHGCPLDRELPWYPDQIQIDLQLGDALLAAGRLDEAIAVRARCLAGREERWPRHAGILERWRADPRLVARSYAREGQLRGDPGRAAWAYGRAAPDEAIDVAYLLDALVATGREGEVALAWSQFGLGQQLTEPVARLAAARCLLAAGEWRRGLEELWRVELTEPGRDVQVAIARAGLLASGAPLEVFEAALGERVAIGATTLARRMARDIADFVPAAARSSIVLRALGKPAAIEFDPMWLAGFGAEPRSRRAIDALFAEHAPPSRGAPAPDPGELRARGDRLVNRWPEAVFAEATEDDPEGLVQAAAYLAGQALGRYLAATTAAPDPMAGSYRAVAAEALALVGRQRGALGDRDARALLGVLDPLLRRVDRWLGSLWLGTVERSCAIDERARGDVAGFAREHATVAARILGPEETAVLAASVARLHRDRPDGWASAVVAQAGRLASHTGHAGCDEWADAVAWQFAAHEIETDDAIDVLHTACYLAEGKSAGPSVHAARVLLSVGRAPAALSVLCAGLGAAEPGWRAAQVAMLAQAQDAERLDVPLARDRVSAQLFDALEAGEPVRAEKLGRLAVALDPADADAHRDLGLALAQQGKIPEALHHLARGAADQATQLLCSVLSRTGRRAEALAALDYASRWHAGVEAWLAHAAIAEDAGDPRRAAAAYAAAYRLDPAACAPSQLSAYARVLGALGDHAACDAIANQLLRRAGGDLVWQTSAWAHLATAALGQGRYDQAIELAERAVQRNPLADHAAGFAAILERARARTPAAPVAPPPPGPPRAPVFERIEAGEHAAAAALLGSDDWRVRRVALTATRFRSSSENAAGVTPRARAAALAVLADTAGLADREAVLARTIALAIREQAWFARDPEVALGDRLTPDAVRRELRAREATVLGDAPASARFADRVAVPEGQLSRVSDYVALIRDLAVLAPAEALAQFDLDEAGYVEVGAAWGEAIAADPSLADSIAAGLAKR